MKNFPVKVDGKEYWISRSIAVCVFVFKIKGNKLYALIERRGKGAADEQGKLCTCSGYLDFNECDREATTRELMEECGFIAKEERLQFMYINSDPKADKRQNVTIHYVYFAKGNEDFNEKKAIGGEVDEVADVKWMDIGNFDKDKVLYVNIYDIMAEDWAFNHDHIMIDHLSKFFKLKYNGQEKEKESD